MATSTAGTAATCCAASQRETAGLSYEQALEWWRATHAETLAQLARLTADQLAAPGPVYPPNWARPHLTDVVTALSEHYTAHMSAEPTPHS